MTAKDGTRCTAVKDDFPFAMPKATVAMEAAMDGNHPSTPRLSVRRRHGILEI